MSLLETFLTASQGATIPVPCHADSTGKSDKSKRAGLWPASLYKGKMRHIQTFH